MGEKENRLRSEDTARKNTNKSGIDIKQGTVFALKAFKKQPIFWAVAVVLCALTVVLGVFAQSIYGFNGYDRVPKTLENNGVKLCNIKFGENYLTENSVAAFSRDKIQEITAQNSHNDLYRYGYANGRQYLLIEGRKDVENLGFELTPYSKDLTDDGVYITDVYAREHLIKKFVYYKNAENKPIRITELEELVGTVYFSAKLNETDKITVDGIIISGYYGKSEFNRVAQTVEEHAEEFYFRNLNSPIYCTEKYYLNNDMDGTAGSEDIKTTGILMKINDYKQLSDYMKSVEWGNDRTVKYYIEAPFGNDLPYSELTYYGKVFLISACILFIITMIVFNLYFVFLVKKDKNTSENLFLLGTSKGKSTAVYILHGVFLSVITAILSVIIAVPFFRYVNIALANRVYEGIMITWLTPVLIAEIILLPFAVIALSSVVGGMKIAKLKSKNTGEGK